MQRVDLLNGGSHRYYNYVPNREIQEDVSHLRDTLAVFSHSPEATRVFGWKQNKNKLVNHQILQLFCS